MMAEHIGPCLAWTMGWPTKQASAPIRKPLASSVMLISAPLQGTTAYCQWSDSEASLCGRHSNQTFTEVKIKFGWA
jgi:hypothetical protein